MTLSIIQTSARQQTASRLPASTKCNVLAMHIVLFGDRMPSIMFLLVFSKITVGLNMLITSKNNIVELSQWVRLAAIFVLFLCSLRDNNFEQL